MLHEMEEDCEVSILIGCKINSIGRGTVYKQFRYNRTKWNRHAALVFRDILSQAARGDSVPTSSNLDELLETYKVGYFYQIWKAKQRRII